MANRATMISSDSPWRVHRSSFDPFPATQSSFDPRRGFHPQPTNWKLLPHPWRKKEGPVCSWVSLDRRNCFPVARKAAFPFRLFSPVSSFPSFNDFSTKTPARLRLQSENPRGWRTPAKRIGSVNSSLNFHSFLYTLSFRRERPAALFLAVQTIPPRELKKSI